MEEHVDQLCQAIAANDLPVVQECLNQEKTIINRRHCTKRTPLHIACILSSPEVVQLLIDHGARITARMENGSTALHLAAARGSVEIIRILCETSNRNKELALHDGLQTSISTDPIGGRNDYQWANDSVALVNVKYGDLNDLAPTGNYLDDQYETGPDILDPNAVSWDTFLSPLHIAIFNGRVDSVRELVSFGADVKRPIKRYEPQYFGSPGRKPTGGVLPLALCFLLESSRAQDMARTLLQLGASPAEADSNRTTPLHLIAAMKDTVPLSVFLENSREDTLRAINYLSIGTSLNGKMYSPLSTAILAGNQKGALDILEAGAKPIIEFDHFVFSMNSAFPGSIGFCDNKREFQSTIQPIIAAVENEFPIVALNLLRSGVDPSTHRHNFANHGSSVLDITREKIKEMRKFLAEPGCSNQTTQSPAMLHDDSEYLSCLNGDSYRFWATKMTLRRARRHFGQKSDTTNAMPKPAPDAKGAKEKRQSVQDRFSEFESLENELLTRKAKLFCELHPHNQNSANNKFSTTLEKNKLYKPVIFDGSRQNQEAYLSLFDAAWAGDIDTIRTLALDWQDEAERKPPLSLGENDLLGFTVLDIAILRGHWGIVNEIIDILHAQHKPHKPRELDYDDYDDEDGDDEDRKLEPPETDDDNVSDSESDYDEYGDEEEGVQERPRKNAVDCVKLRASPLRVALLCGCPAYLFTAKSEEADRFRVWPAEDGSPIFITDYSGQAQKKGIIEHAILMNDLDLLRFLLDMAKSLTDRDHRRRTMDSFLTDTFFYALKLGRIDCLSMIIEKSGASLYEQRPTYHFQRLSNNGEPTAYSKSPILAAAMEGDLEATRWIMGPDPIQHYVEYIKAHEDDPRLERFTKSEDGIEKSVLKWLHHRDDLVLHCAIKSKPCEESERLIRYLINRYPEYMAVRSEEGHTPLSLAFTLQRASFARILINFGADQTVRDKSGNNLLHLLLAWPQSVPTGFRSCLDPEILREMLDMLNPNYIRLMLAERNKNRCQTPLMRWVSCQKDSYGQDTMQNIMMNGDNPDRDGHLPIAKLLLSYGAAAKIEQLELFDDNGNIPAHAAVTLKLPRLLQLFLDGRPDLLHKENFSGQTPADLANVEWAKFAINEDRIAHRCPLVINTQFRPTTNNVVERDPLSFVDSEVLIEADKGRPHHRTVNEICHCHANSGNSQRKLFTAEDAAAIVQTKDVNAPLHFCTPYCLFYEG